MFTVLLQQWNLCRINLNNKNVMKFLYFLNHFTVMIFILLCNLHFHCAVYNKCFNIQYMYLKYIKFLNNYFKVNNLLFNFYFVPILFPNNQQITILYTVGYALLLINVINIPRRLFSYNRSWIIHIILCLNIHY